jgi:hypothetical protein
MTEDSIRDAEAWWRGKGHDMNRIKDRVRDRSQIYAKLGAFHPLRLHDQIA